MNKAKRKIITGAIAVVCAVGGMSAISVIGNKAEKGSVPVSLSSFDTQKPVVILDAGHGGIDGGCTSAEGVPEKGINLNILLRLRDLLCISGYDVIVTRDTDMSIHDKGIEGIANQKSSDMDNRLELFNSRNDAICISIHQNQFTEPKYKGAQMFYSDNNSKSETLARSLQGNFRRLIQPDNEREIKLCGKELFLCYYSQNPTVMVECGFLSNPDEAALLNTEEYQGKVAFTIFSGINEYVNQK